MKESKAQGTSARKHVNIKGTSHEDKWTGHEYKPWHRENVRHYNKYHWKATDTRFKLPSLKYHFSNFLGSSFVWFTEAESVYNNDYVSKVEQNQMDH